MAFEPWSWHNLWSSFIGAIAGAGIVQVCLSHLFSRKLEGFKTELSAKLFEQQTRFAWLHNERSRVLVRLYRLLSILDTAFNDMVRPIRIGSKEDWDADKVRAAKAAVTFFDFYDRNRIFFDEELALELEKLDDEYRRVWADFESRWDFPSTRQEWDETWTKLEKDVPLIRMHIKHTIGKMLGVT